MQQQQQQKQQVYLQQPQKQQNNRNAHLFIEQEAATPASATTKKRLQLYPGLLDESLLNRGSFSFGAKTVKFDELKVLGNIYVLKVNGKKLRDTYLLKSTLDKRKMNEETKVHKRAGGNEEMRLQILA